MVDAARHPRIELMTLTEITSCSGYVGNFQVTLEKKPRLVEDLCNGCRDCIEVCPIKVPSEFDLGLAPRHAIYQPFSQAVPSTFLIDEKACIHCYRCVDVCEKRAINFSQKSERIQVEIGTIVLATGFDGFEAEAMSVYGYGRYADVITSMELERLLDPGGPTEGELIRPSDFGKPRRIAFIQCVGSRDLNHNEYCSGYCCMASLKAAVYMKDKYPESEIAIFYMDIRTPSKGYEEFFRGGLGKRVYYLYTASRPRWLQRLRGTRSSSIPKIAAWAGLWNGKRIWWC